MREEYNKKNEKKNQKKPSFFRLIDFYQLFDLLDSLT